MPSLSLSFLLVLRIYTLSFPLSPYPSRTLSPLSSLSLTPSITLPPTPASLDGTGHGKQNRINPTVAN
jgi:hypothetical protein